MRDEPINSRRPFNATDLTRLRSIAETEDKGGRRWQWSGGYPQTVTRLGDAVLIANTFDNPDSPSPAAEFIAAFDPPTVLRLLDEVMPQVIAFEELRHSVEIVMVPTPHGPERLLYIPLTVVERLLDQAKPSAGK